MKTGARLYKRKLPGEFNELNRALPLRPIDDDISLDNAQEQVVLNDLVPVTPDATLTVVFIPLTGANAYATIGQRNQVALADRYFIFVNTTLALTVFSRRMARSANDRGATATRKWVRGPYTGTRRIHVPTSGP